ncbi:AAA family ATPase [bacterium]|nr:AAA family ATPase [bacterium]
MIRLLNCNNIESGEISIINNHLNIKYGFNGTGKSTISNAITAKINNNDSALKALMPFKYKESGTVIPEVQGVEDFNSVKVFNEEYVNSYAFQRDELIKNSFEVFIKTPDYDEHMNKISELLKTIHSTFTSDDTLQSLINDLQAFVESYGKTKNSFAASSLLGKGLGKGNKLKNIPEELKRYTPFLSKTDTNVKWLKWQITGRDYWVDNDICPYCAANISDNKEDIEKISKNFDSKEIDSLNKILDIFNVFNHYFSDDTKKKIKIISDNIAGVTSEQKSYLAEIRAQAITLLEKLNGLKSIGYTSLSNVDKVNKIINDFKIDISFLSHFDSDFVREKVFVINQSIESVSEKIGELQGQVNQQKKLIKKTIDEYEKQINKFLEYAGYKYCVALEGDANDYKLKLHHKEYNEEIPGDESHLSYGEKNAFALALFMYSALHENPDLIILDDPISSFDGNKKFAIINMLFMGSNSFKDKTVLLLTHEFNIVIDTIYNFKNRILPIPIANFLSIKNGILSEKAIEKTDIKSFVEIAKDKINSSIDMINKSIFLRRLFELQGEKDDKWDLLSSLLHKRVKPTKRNDSDEVEMSLAEIQKAERSIQEYLNGFSYSEQIARVIDFDILKQLYCDCDSNYEKLQIFRIVFENAELNDVVKQFINKTYHVENDFIFQLDPAEYDTIPQYIVEICDNMIDTFVTKTTVE